MSDYHMSQDRLDLFLNAGISEEEAKQAMRVSICAYLSDYDLIDLLRPVVKIDGNLSSIWISDEQSIINSILVKWRKSGKI